MVTISTVYVTVTALTLLNQATLVVVQLLKCGIE